MSNDTELLSRYAEDHSEAAITELIQRYVDLVYSAALRLASGDAHGAQDVTQQVFSELAQQAHRLSKHPALVGWLYTTTRRIALHTNRTEQRRKTREREAHIMTELLREPVAGEDWDPLRPVLEDAMHDLAEKDRLAVLLRYFQNKQFKEVGTVLGLNENAARMRVDRALDKLRAMLTQRGVTLSAAGLGAALASNAVQAAPVGLAVTISTAAALAGTAIVTTATATATKTIAMTTLQKTIMGATLVAAIGTGIYEARQASILRRQNQSLQQQQAPLTGRLAELKTENERLSNLIAQAGDSQILSRAQFNELLKLRGKATLAQTDSRELAQLKSTLARQTGKMPDYLTNALATGMSTAETWKKKDALARLARMKKMLNLTEDQERAISDIMMNHIQRQSQMTLDLLTGKSTPEQQQAQAGGSEDHEAEVKALFSPEQLAAYPEYTQAEKTAAAENSAKSDASRIADDFSLSKEQQEKLRSLFYEMNLKEPASALNQQAITQAGKSDRLADAANMSVELQKWQLEEKLKILGNYLSPEQLATYRQEQMDRITRQAAAMKMFLPQKTAGTTN